MRSLYLINISVLLILVADSVDAGCSETNPCIEDLGQGQPFVEPKQLDTSSGEICLSVDIADVEFGWLKLKRRVYNGSVTGPTWNVNKGEHLKLTLNNFLSPLNNEVGKPENEMKRPNTTNMHTHGVHISANPPEDSVLVNIAPGDRYLYEYNFHEEHPSGTFWYHAHVHGSTQLQVTSGMAGMLIINDVPNITPYQLGDVSCPENCEADIQMVIQGLLLFNKGFNSFAQIQQSVGDDPYFQQDSIITSDGSTLTDWLSKNVNFMTVNGLLEPILTMEQGKPYRFRMVNAAGDDTVEPLITLKGRNDSADACQIREIAYDGIYLDRPRKLRQGQSFLAPGNRVDWMVRCDTPGTYELRSYANPANKASMGDINRWNGLLVTLEVQADSHQEYDDRRDEITRLLEKMIGRDGGSRKKRYFGGGREHGGYDGDHGPFGGYGDNYGHNGGYGGDHGPFGGYGGHEGHFGGYDNDHGPFGGYGGDHGYHGGYGDGYDHGHGPFGGDGGDHGPFVSEDHDFNFNLPPRPNFVNDTRDEPEENIKQRFVVEFSTGFILNREHWSTADNFRYAMTVGEMQEWHIVNTDNEGSHPFHPHVNSFQVISYNKYTGPFFPGFSPDPVLVDQVNKTACYYQRAGLLTRTNPTVPENALEYLGHEGRYTQDAGNTLGYARIGDWRDTLLVPPLSNITIRFIPDRYVCPVIIHCHFLPHEDRGMMMITKVVGKGESLAANTKSGNAYPGTCQKCDRYPFNNPKTLCDQEKRGYYGHPILYRYLSKRGAGDE